MTKAKADVVKSIKTEVLSDSTLRPVEKTNIQQAIKKVNEAKTANDLREARKAYDNATPDRVKNANEMSDNALQKQKAVWLETRAKLNTMLDDVTS